MKTLSKSEIKQLFVRLPLGYKQDKELRKHFIYSITNDRLRTSTTDLTLVEANKLLNLFGCEPLSYDNWGYYDMNNPQHMYMLSLLHQLGWVEWSTKHSKNIPDIMRFSEFLKSKKSPVNKPLKEMGTLECTKIINALESMLSKFINITQ